MRASGKKVRPAKSEFLPLWRVFHFVPNATPSDLWWCRREAMGKSTDVLPTGDLDGIRFSPKETPMKDLVE
jgi:hypothetical protein